MRTCGALRTCGAGRPGSAGRTVDTCRSLWPHRAGGASRPGCALCALRASRPYRTGSSLLACWALETRGSLGPCCTRGTVTGIGDFGDGPEEGPAIRAVAVLPCRKRFDGDAGLVGARRTSGSLRTALTCRSMRAHRRFRVCR